MKPDRTNYEIWLIDYLEGNLDDKQVELLMLFLEENSDIKEEFYELAQYNVKPGINSYPDKDNLKKFSSDLNQLQFEYLCIASSENDLSEEQIAELEEIVAQNPENKKTYDLLHKTKLFAPDFEYKRKNSLKKLTTTQKVIRFSLIGLSAAAAITFIVLILKPAVINDINRIASVASNPGKDTTIIITNSYPVAEINSKEENRINVLQVSKNIIQRELKSVPVETTFQQQELLPSDSSVTIPNVQQIGIAPIEFRQDVILIEKPVSSTLVAMRTINQIPVLNDEPGFNEFIARLFREKIFKSEIPAKGPLKAYEIADAGITGLNKLLGWQITLKKNMDEKGELKSLYFSSKILKFNSPVKKI
jgi:hypothetical protein